MPQHNTTQPGKKIVVIGASGAGKSAVAKRLSEILGLSYICSDAIFWAPNWTQAPPKQRDLAYDHATLADAWAIDGNVGGLNKPKDRMIVDRADTIVWLDLPRWQVFTQVLGRTIRRAWTQEPMWHNNRENWRRSFFSRESILLWSMQTFAKRRMQYDALFTDPNYAHLIRIRLTTRRQVDAWLASLEVAIH